MTRHPQSILKTAALLAAPFALLAASQVAAQTGSSASTSSRTTTASQPTVHDEGMDDQPQSTIDTKNKHGKRKLPPPPTNDTRSSSPTMPEHTQPAMAPGAPTEDDNSPRDAGNTTPNAGPR